MRSSLFRSRRDSSDTEPLLPARPGPNQIQYEQAEGNYAAMAHVGTSQAVLVEPRSGARKLPQYIAALAAALGPLASGTMLGWSSPVVFKIIQSNNTDYDFDVSDLQGDWISSLTNLGGAVICFPIGLIMDVLGRRKAMLLLVIPFVIGWFLISFATNVAMLMAGRFLTGVGAGGFSVAVPAYVSEITEDSIRGSVGSFFFLMVTIGILYAYVVGSYTSVFIFNITCTLIPIIFGLIFFFMPETPYFLVSKGKDAEAKAALRRLRGSSYDIDDELNVLQKTAELARNNPISFRKAITKKSAIKAVMICYALMFFQQLSGINAVLFNSSSIFGSAASSLSPAVSSIIIGSIQVVMTFTSSLVVDRLGRRILLLFSALVMCICTVILGVFFFLQDVHGADSSIITSITWLPLVSLSLFIIAFSLGFGPIPWMMAGELCLIDIKGFVASTSGTLNAVLSFVITSTFNSLNAAIGSGQVFWMFAGILLLGFLFIFLVIPETKGKSFEEIQILLGAEPKTIDEKVDEKK